MRDTKIGPILWGWKEKTTIKSRDDEKNKNRVRKTRNISTWKKWEWKKENEMKNEKKKRKNALKKKMKTVKYDDRKTIWKIADIF